MRHQSNITVSIYALVDPVTGEVRYIGQTSQRLPTRLSNHIAQTESSPVRRRDWLRSLKARGLRPRIELLESSDGAHANEVEDGYIALYRNAGHDLTNDAKPMPYPAEARIKATWIYVTARVPEEMHGQLRALSEVERMSIAHTVFILLREALAARTQATAARRGDAGQGEEEW